MKLLFIGDIIGSPGREVLAKSLCGIIAEYGVRFVVANGENSAGGLGITPEVFNELLSSGVDVVTSGNHIWKRKEVLDIIGDSKLLRPANFPQESPGKGFNIYQVGETPVAVINLEGRVFMEAIDCPFAVADRVIPQLSSAKVILVDFHAEATSEKIALGWYLDGKVSAVIGTHTHVQTSDSRILPQGTAYISDAGMTGSKDGVIGVQKEEIIKHFITRMPFSYKPCKGNSYFEGVFIDVDERNGKARSIKALSLPV